MSILKSDRKKVRHTSSDVAVEVVAALLTGWSSGLLLEGGLGSAPVGRPRSCRTCKETDGKHIPTSSRVVKC